MDLVNYYRDRAAEYEKVYSKTERKADLMVATEILQGLFAKKDLLEIACGTGYWTQKIAATASKILATDINKAVLEIAEKKIYSPASVIFRVCDFNVVIDTSSYDGLFGGFIWSHIKVEDLDDFIDKILGYVKPGGIITFIDNKYVMGNSSTIVETDNFGNTYQERTLENGSIYKILKNYPTDEFIKEKFGLKAYDLEITKLNYYWIMTCKKHG